MAEGVIGGAAGVVATGLRIRDSISASGTAFFSYRNTNAAANAVLPAAAMTVPETKPFRWKR